MSTALHLVDSVSAERPHDFNMYHFSDLSNAPFNTRDYSRMKFGSNRAAKRFAYPMADRFFHLYRDLLSGPCVVIPAPSTTVSVAATMLSRHFMNRLNEHLDTFGLEPVEWTLIHRNMTYNNNYAHLPKEERKKLLAADSIYLNKEFVSGKTLIFVDDVRITGTHEEKITDYMREIGLPNPFLFVTLASYEGQDAAIEGRLNHVEIVDAHDLVLLSHETDHEVTTRSLRLLLEAPEQDFEQIIAQAPQRFREATYHAAIVKGYNRHEPYRANFEALRKSVNR